MNKSNANELMFSKDTKDTYNYCRINLENNKVCITTSRGDKGDAWGGNVADFYFNKKQLSRLIKHLQKLEKQLDVNI